MEISLFEKTQAAAAKIRTWQDVKAHHAIILGTGLDDVVTMLEKARFLSYTDIPYFTKGAVQSHQGKLVYGKMHGHPLMIFSGRSHYYEGYSAAEVAFPVQVLAALGVKHVLLSNAAGGVSPHFKEGDIVMIEDHINLMPDNPLRGKNDERIGPRFPDMLYAYCPETIAMFFRLSAESGIPLKKGIYLALPGPNLETPAEYAMAYRLGADLVGMSTVPEVIAARHAGLKVTAFSIVSNVCYPKNILTPTTVDDVIRTVKTSSGRLADLLSRFFAHLS